MGSTFNAEETINTLTGNNSTWVSGGDWNFQAINGVNDKFYIDMTMIALNGTDRHHMLITNFTQSENNQVKNKNVYTIYSIKILVSLSVILYCSIVVQNYFNT